MRHKPCISSSDLRCILCKRSEESIITGALSKSQNVAAHENCLLFSSGIFCKHSPTFDDLFGFDVEDVRKEYKRGRKLKCRKCRQNGATTGCEIKSCKHSYHYPCAMEADAVTEEGAQGTFKLFCAKHKPCASTVVGSKKREAEVSCSGFGHKRPKTSDQSNNCGGSESDSQKIRFSCRETYQKPLFGSDSEPEDITHSIPNIDRLVSEDSSSNIKEPTPEAVSTSSNGGGDDNDDLSRDSDCESQSLLCTEYRQENVLFTVIADSGTSIESVEENSPESSPPGATSPADSTMSSLNQIGSFPQDPPLINLPVLESSSSNSTGESSKIKEASGGILPIKTDCPQNVKPLLKKEDELPQSEVNYHPLDLTAEAPSCSSRVHFDEHVSHVGISSSGAAIFWRRCNELACTEIIFTQLKHQLSVLADRVQNHHATEEDYTVSRNILKASGKLPTILRQLEQDLEDQNRSLQKKRDALRAAKEVLHEN